MSEVFTTFSQCLKLFQRSSNDFFTAAMIYPLFLRFVSSAIGFWGLARNNETSGCGWKKSKGKNLRRLHARFNVAADEYFMLFLVYVLPASKIFFWIIVAIEKKETKTTLILPLNTKKIPFDAISRLFFASLHQKHNSSSRNTPKHTRNFCTKSTMKTFSLIQENFLFAVDSHVCFFSRSQFTLHPVEGFSPEILSKKSIISAGNFFIKSHLEIRLLRNFPEVFSSVDRTSNFFCLREKKAAPNFGSRQRWNEKLPSYLHFESFLIYPKYFFFWLLDTKLIQEFFTVVLTLYPNFRLFRGMNFHYFSWFLMAIHHLVRTKSLFLLHETFHSRFHRFSTRKSRIKLQNSTTCQ